MKFIFVVAGKQMNEIHDIETGREIFLLKEPWDPLHIHIHCSINTWRYLYCMFEIFNGRYFIFLYIHINCCENVRDGAHGEVESEE